MYGLRGEPLVGNETAFKYFNYTLNPFRNARKKVFSIQITPLSKNMPSAPANSTR